MHGQAGMAKTIEFVVLIRSVYILIGSNATLSGIYIIQTKGKTPVLTHS